MPIRVNIDKSINHCQNCISGLEAWVKIISELLEKNNDYEDDFQAHLQRLRDVLEEGRIESLEKLSDLKMLKDIYGDNPPFKGGGDS